MSVKLVASVQKALDSVIKKEFKSTPKIEATEGNKDGEGFTSHTYSVTVEVDERKLSFFIKYREEEFYSKIFKNELKFYKEIYPAMLKFQQQKKIDNPFKNVPKHYPSEDDEKDRIPPIILEDLKLKGYITKTYEIDEKFIKCVLETFANYHAVSFAMKNQEPALYNELVKDIGDMYSEAFRSYGLDKLVRKSLDRIRKCLDPTRDKNLFGQTKDLEEKLIKHACNLDKMVDDYGALCQGDCWINNIMFLCDKKSGDAIDLKLVDWQALRVNSPMLDLSYFLYTTATKQVLDELDDYLKFYHSKLSDRITKLGSNPEELYPFDVLERHWKHYSRFGLTMATFVIKNMLFEKEEVREIVPEGSDQVSAEGFDGTFAREDEYMERIKNLLQHFIDRDLL